MTSLLQDLRYALRSLRNHSGFAAVAILTIAIGIGANTTIFSWLRSLLLNPFPAAVEPERIIAIENTAPDGAPITTSYLDFRDFRNNLRLVKSVTAYRSYLFSVGEVPNVERAWGELASGGVFDMFGLKPEAGRFFTLEEQNDSQNAHAVVVISYDYWKSHYGLNPSAVGSMLRINQTPLTIIGVAPLGFHGTHAGLDYSFWIPLTMYGQMTHTGTWILKDRNARFFMLLARLAPGVSILQAIVGIARDSKYHRVTENPQPYFYIPVRQIFQPEYGLTFHVRTSGSINDAIVSLRREAAAIDPAITIFDAEPMTEYISASLFGAKITADLLSLLSGIGLLLAAMGLYGVMAYSVAQRTREFGLRLAIGARQIDILMLILRESAGLALFGTIVGLILAALSTRVVASQIYSVSPLDPLTFAAVGLALLVVSFLASYIPAYQAAKIEPMVALRYE